MIPPGANRFLDCVLHRGGNDTVLLIAVMLFAIIGIPGFALYQVVPLYIEYGTEFSLTDFYTYLLFMTILVSFFTYGMVAAVDRHHRRDAEWMEALLEYAAGQGKIVTAMEIQCGRMREHMKPWLRRYLFASFVVLLVANILQAIIWPYDYILVPELIVIFFILINLCITNVYVMHMMCTIDSIQIGFMHAFCDSFVNEQPILEEMNTGIKVHSLWPHVLLMVLMVGLYSMFFSLWSTHIMNVHIKKQWVYEESVIRWMMAKHEMGSIKIRETPNKPTLIQTIYRII